MFQCCSLETSHPRLLPQSPKVCSIHLCLFFCKTFNDFWSSLYKIWTHLPAIQGPTKSVSYWYLWFYYLEISTWWGLPRWISGKGSTCNRGDTVDVVSIPGSGGFPGGGHGHPAWRITSERSLVGYSPQCHKEPEMTEVTWRAHTWTRLSMNSLFYLEGGLCLLMEAPCPSQRSFSEDLI